MYKNAYTPLFLCTVPCVGLQYRSKMCENVKFVKSAKKAETK